MTGPDTHSSASTPLVEAPVKLFGSADPWSGYAALQARPGLHYEPAEHMYYAARHTDVHHGLRHPDLAVGFPFRATRQLFGRTAIDLDAPCTDQLAAWSPGSPAPTCTPGPRLPSSP